MYLYPPCAAMVVLCGGLVVPNGLFFGIEIESLTGTRPNIIYRC